MYNFDTLIVYKIFLIDLKIGVKQKYSTLIFSHSDLYIATPFDDWSIYMCS